MAALPPPFAFAGILTWRLAGCTRSGGILQFCSPDPMMLPRLTRKGARMTKTPLAHKRHLAHAIGGPGGVQPGIDTLQAVLQELWAQVEQLQESIAAVGDEIVLKTGDASIVLKKDGTITIKGKTITIDGSGDVRIKATRDMVLKGQKILQN
jgi:hypothetical protein